MGAVFSAVAPLLLADGLLREVVMTRQLGLRLDRLPYLLADQFLGLGRL
jgi:hypothetical protein